MANTKLTAKQIATEIEAIKAGSKPAYKYDELKAVLGERPFADKHYSELTDDQKAKVVAYHDAENKLMGLTERLVNVIAWSKSDKTLVKETQKTINGDECVEFKFHAREAKENGAFFYVTHLVNLNAKNAEERIAQMRALSNKRGSRYVIKTRDAKDYYRDYKGQSQLSGLTAVSVFARPAEAQAQTTQAVAEVEEQELPF